MEEKRLGFQYFFSHTITHQYDAYCIQQNIPKAIDILRSYSCGFKLYLNDKKLQSDSIKICLLNPNWYIANGNNRLTKSNILVNSSKHKSSVLCINSSYFNHKSFTGSIDAYLFDIFSMRTWIVEFGNVLKAYIFKSSSKDRQTSSAIANASLSHQVPARDIPPPAPPSPTFRKRANKYIRKSSSVNYKIRHQ